MLHFEAGNDAGNTQADLERLGEERGRAEVERDAGEDYGELVGEVGPERLEQVVDARRLEVGQVDGVVHVVGRVMSRNWTWRGWTKR